jgi:hypothetical protein
METFDMREFTFKLTDEDVAIVLNSLREANLKLKETMFLTMGTEHCGPTANAANQFYKLEQRIFHEHRAQLQELAKDQK